MLKEYEEWVRENNIYKDFTIGLTAAFAFFVLQRYTEIEGSFLVQIIGGAVTFIIVLVSLFIMTFILFFFISYLPRNHPK